LIVTRGEAGSDTAMNIPRCQPWIDSGAKWFDTISDVP
jgi:hypothetical protein